ncbi:hypothetical protein [Pedosphaera parvula]|uniref:Uncharacterized protein n=1 Tax=Pedosphaera parvula (strain Ellin514) TaxID=320771 RepID=B9XLF9_PEDPL|nr:hypothetical protein [Pedosphaera parvula]EEF59362.1 hypothetical protein Cflav_PD1910 [Pedosphaera parvula Ellin514]
MSTNIHVIRLGLGQELVLDGCFSNPVCEWGIRRYRSVSVGIGRYRSVSVGIGRYRSVSVGIGRYRTPTDGIGRQRTVSDANGRYRTVKKILEEGEKFQKWILKQLHGPFDIGLSRSDI